MANTANGTDLGDDILLDEQSLGDLSLDDDGLFDDLDSEIKLDEPGEDLDLNLDDFGGAPGETDDADLDLSLDDLDAAPVAEASDDDLGLSLDDLDAAPAAEASDDDLGLSLDDLDATPAAEASDDDLDLSLDDLDAASAAEASDDDLGLSLDDLDAAPAAEASDDDLGLSLDDLDEGPAATAADDELDLPPLDDGLDDLLASDGSSDEMDVGSGDALGDGLDDLVFDEDAGTGTAVDELDAEPDLGEEELETEIDLDLDEDFAAAPELEEDDEGELALSEDIESEAGDEGFSLDEDELDFSLQQHAEPEEEDGAGFQAAPDVDLDELDLSEEMSALAEPTDDVGHEELTAGEAPDAGAAFDAPFDAGAEEPFEAIENIDLEESPVLELDVDDEIELAEEEESMMPSATPHGAAAESATLTAERRSYELPTEPAQAPARGVVPRDVLLSIPHRLSAEVGSVTLDGEEILELGYGSVVQLERSVGDPVDLVLEGRSIAKGEIVLINGKNLGVRIVSMSKG